MFKFMFLIALSAGALQYTKAVCNQCHELSGVACKSETEFHPCVKGVPDTTQTFSCLEPDHVCTSKGPICVSKVDNPQITPACGDTSKCGQCDAVDDGKYTCTSRTTFTMCFDGELSDIRVSCPERQICDVAKAKEGENPCVLSCKEPEIEICDLDQPIDMPVTTTTEAPTTTTQVPTTTTEIPTTTTEIPTTTTEVPTTTTQVPTTTTEVPTTTTQVPTTTTQVPTTTTQVPPTNTTPAPVTTTTEVPTTTVPITTTTTAEPITTTTTEVIPSPTTTTTQPTTTTTEAITTTTIISPTPTTTEEPTTTPTLPPTTTTENPANIVCSQQTAVGRYPYPNDTTCRNYIYCFRKGGQMQTTFMRCPNNLYFNPSTSLCGAARPAGCI